MTRLAVILERYGEAIEVDLSMRQVDLATEWAARRTRKLLNLIEHLPTHSHYMQAYLNDEEMAEALADRLTDEDEPAEAPPEKFTDWTPEMFALARIEDVLHTHLAITIKAAGGKPSNPKPAKRPTTALHRVRTKRDSDARRSRNQRVMDRLAPKQ